MDRTPEREAHGARSGREPSLAASLRVEELDAAFPFHLLVDATLRILSVGSVLRRMLPDATATRLLTECFEVLEPGAPVSLETLARSARTPVLVQARSVPELRLRGQFLVTADRERLLFIGAPRLSVEGMTKLGLEVTDFPPHDGVPDYLSQLKAQEERLARELEGRARMEDELRIAQRLETVGQLAAGVAHEINTPIQYVGDSLFFLKDAFEDFVQLVRNLRAAAPPEVADEHWDTADADFLIEQVPKALERMFHGVDRVASIVRAMKAFAHPGSDTKEPSNLNEALQTTLTVSRNEYKYVADVETDLAELPLVPCNLGELNQVFLNLVVNAAHAIAATVEGTENRGKICVRTRREDPHVVIEVEDTGTGIPDAVKPRIFDPFFTTKPVGKGTGQGLPLARSIVLKHGGTLTFESEVGKGTVFTIRLPLTEGQDGSIGSYSLRG